MKLYSGPLSLFTAKVRVALAEKGLDYERVEVEWSRQDRYLPHHPEVSAINPKGQVPCLVDGDVTLYDSTVILEYLEDRHPEPALYPRDVADRARCRQLELEADELLLPCMFQLIEERFYPPGAEGRDEVRSARAVAEVADLYTRLDKRLAGREYLCDSFSVADIATLVMAYPGVTLGVAIPDSLSNLSAWATRVAARPAVKREMEEMTAFAARAMG